MAHFAEINENNIVQRVLVVDNDNEDRGQEFLADDLGLSGIWVQCSYNHNFRGCFPAINYHYDADLDVFYPPNPHPSWTLDTSLSPHPNWVSPAGLAPDGGHRWNEESQQWEKPPKPEDYPSSIWNSEMGAWTPPVAYPDDGKTYEWNEQNQEWVELSE